MINTDLDVKIKDEGVFDVLDRLVSLDGGYGVRMNAIAAAAAADEVQQDYGPRWAMASGSWYRRSSFYQKWKRGLGLDPGTLTGTTEQAITPTTIPGGGMVYLRGTWPQYGILEHGYHEKSQLSDEDLSSDPLGPRRSTVHSLYQALDYGSFDSPRALLESKGIEEGSVPLATKRYGEWEGRDIDFMFLTDDNTDVIMEYMKIFLEREVLEGVADARIERLLKEGMTEEGVSGAKAQATASRKEGLLAQRDLLRSGAFGGMNPEEAISRLQRIERLLRKKGWL